MVKQCCLVPINAQRMILILGKVVQYYAMQMRGRGAARKEELVPVHPPKNIVGMLIDKMY